MGMPARRIEADPFAHRTPQLRLVTTPAAPEPARTPRTTRTGSRSTNKATVATRTAPHAAKGTQPSAATRARVRQDEARARAVFGIFVAVLVCAITLGGARVTLISRAAEAAITEGRVQADIKAQRAEADKLEVDRSALSTPSRIAGIAATSMDMGEPRSVRYISLDGQAPATSGSSAANADAATSADAGVASDAVASNDAVGALFGAVMDLSAGEAQSLLVGDLGLAGSH